jgi:hypothetical protein
MLTMLRWPLRLALMTGTKYKNAAKSSRPRPKVLSVCAGCGFVSNSEVAGCIGCGFASTREAAGCREASNAA